MGKCSIITLTLSFSIKILKLFICGKKHITQNLPCQSFPGAQLGTLRRFPGCVTFLTAIPRTCSSSQTDTLSPLDTHSPAPWPQALALHPLPMSVEETPPGTSSGGKSESTRPSVPGLFLPASRPQGAATLTVCQNVLLCVSIVRGWTLGSPLLSRCDHAAVNTCRHQGGPPARLWGCGRQDCLLRLQAGGKGSEAPPCRFPHAALGVTPTSSAEGGWVLCLPEHDCPVLGQQAAWRLHRPGL